MQLHCQNYCLNFTIRENFDQLYQKRCSHIGMRKLPRPFKMPWGKGMVIDEVSISSKYHEPTIQLLEFDNGDKLLRFCSYSHGRFSRSPLMIDEKDLRRLGKAAAKSKQIRKLMSKLSE